MTNDDRLDFLSAQFGRQMSELKEAILRRLVPDGADVKNWLTENAVEILSIPSCEITWLMVAGRVVGVFGMRTHGEAVFPVFESGIVPADGRFRPLYSVTCGMAREGLVVRGPTIIVS
jgi:hypothetical protein